MLVRILLVLLYIFISSLLRSQSLSIDYLESRVEINQTHLQPPQTAGADYAPSIPLNQGAFVSVQGVRSRTNWCLLAYHTEPLQGSATLKITPDIASVPQENIDTNTPTQLLLQGQPQPLFFRHRTLRPIVPILHPRTCPCFPECEHYSGLHTVPTPGWRLPAGAIKKTPRALRARGVYENLFSR